MWEWFQHVMTGAALFAASLIAAGAYASTPVVDTTSKTINGRDGTAEFTIDDGTSIINYKCILDTMRIREITPMDPANVFCTEGTSDQDPGTSTLLFEIAGLGKKGGGASGPFIPAPQDVAVIFTFSEGCTLSMRINSTESYADRLSGQSMRIGLRGMNKGAYVLVWDLGAP
jgi:hypothetical protein